MDIKIILESLKNKGFLIDINDLEDNRVIWQTLIDETRNLSLINKQDELTNKIINNLEWSNKKLKLINKELCEEQMEIIEFSLLHDLRHFCKNNHNEECDCNWINIGKPIHLNTYLVCKHCNKKI